MTLSIGKAKTFGEKNPNKKFYVIWRKSGTAGFFSNLFFVCAHLEIAEKFGLIPVVDMKNHPVFYNETTIVNGTENSWEYYFEQASEYSLNEVYESKTVYLCDGEMKMEIYNHFRDFEYAHKMIERYIKVKSDVLAWVDDFSNQFFKGNVLGIQFRGQEMKYAPYHVTPPTVAQMIDRTKQMIKEHNIEKIFLVTEDKGYLTIFQKEFKDILIYTDAFRTYEGVNAYTIEPKPRDLHMYKLGLEILRDMLLLSKTNYLLASGKDELAYGSNVSYVAQIFNMTNSRYKRVELIFNGTNPEMIIVKEPLQSMIAFARKIKGLLQK